MTMVTYTLAPIDQGVTSGVHNGKIINTKIITFQDSNETQFSVEWKIGESTFFDKFKLWDETETKRKYAQEKLDKLCKAANVVMPKQKEGETVHFDANVLVGKQINVSIHAYTTPDGKTYHHIPKEGYAPPDLGDIFTQEIPF
jgi:hypothetical protein